MESLLWTGIFEVLAKTPPEVSFCCAEEFFAYMYLQPSAAVSADVESVGSAEASPAPSEAETQKAPPVFKDPNFVVRIDLVLCHFQQLRSCHDEIGIWKKVPTLYK